MVVGDDQDPTRGRGPSRPGADLVDERAEQVVGGPAAGMADGHPGRDPLAAQPAIGRAVEDQLDRDLGRDGGPQPTEERRRWRGPGSTLESVEQVRPVDQEAVGRRERVAGAIGAGRRVGTVGHGAILRAVRVAATIERVSLLLLVDLDGVVYRGSEPVPGVAAVLADRAARGDDVVYVTNNSMHYRADYVTRLSAMGAPISPDTVVSSARATALHLANHEPGVRRVLVLGASGLERELRDVGLDVVTAGYAATRMHQEGIDGWTAAGAPEAVVTGLDPALTYLRLAAAADCVRAGARSIATNRDPTYPTERGLRPGAGSIAAALEATTGVTPYVIGKPEPHLLELAAEAVGRPVGEAVMIGDGIHSDLAAARAVGARCVFMLTGVTTPEQLAALPADQRPSAVAADATELAALLDGLG